MRVALVMGALLAVVVAGTANAKPANHGVTGGVGYYVADIFGERDFYRHFSVTAETGRPNMGNWTWNRPEATYSGDVTCVEQSGADVWIAGSVRHNGPLDVQALFARIHDGGAGSKGDTVFVWGVLPDDELQDMDALCHSMVDVDEDLFGEGAFMYTVTTGNASVH